MCIRITCGACENTDCWAQASALLVQQIWEPGFLIYTQLILLLVWGSQMISRIWEVYKRVQVSRSTPGSSDSARLAASWESLIVKLPRWFSHLAGLGTSTLASSGSSGKVAWWFCWCSNFFLQFLILMDPLLQFHCQISLFRVNSTFLD